VWQGKSTEGVEREQGRVADEREGAVGKGGDGAEKGLDRNIRKL
jgi:hypothetical protein